MSDQERVEHYAEQGRELRELYPGAGRVPLHGLYLCQDLRRRVPAAGAYIYTNFITSLDGRIALVRADTGELGVPQQTANPRDWRLLLELAAPADAIIVSGRYLRQLAAGTAQAWPPFSGEAAADLDAFREAQALPAQPVLVVVSRSLDVPVAALPRLAERRVIVATVDEAPAARLSALRAAGAEVLRLGGADVDGARLVAALAEREIRLAFSIAGPAVLYLLLRARVLQRLYLTTVLRVLAGDSYATLARGPVLDPPYDLQLAALYLDRHGPDGVEQLLQVYDARGPALAERSS